MNQIFNRRDQTRKRQELRNHMPAAEQLIWAQLRGGICGVKFRRQVSFGPFVVDFYCPALKLALEIDGPTHENDEAAVYDVARQEQIELLGVRFLRFTNAQVYNHLPNVMETIQANIAKLQSEVAPENPLCPPGISPSTKGRDSVPFEQERQNNANEN